MVNLVEMAVIVCQRKCISAKLINSPTKVAGIALEKNEKKKVDTKSPHNQMFRTVISASRRSAFSAAKRHFSSRQAHIRHGAPKIKAAVLTGTAVALLYPWNKTNNDADADKITKEIEAAGGSDKPDDYTVLKESEKVKAASSENAEEATRAVEVGDESPEHEEGQAAYNPETGEINWDCPCLGGMAHGPCGEEFKEAFSCFVYSETEPKGMDCIKKFEAMRTCFKQHPEHYKEELADDDEEVPSVDGGSEVAAFETDSAVESSIVEQENAMLPENQLQRPVEVVAHAEARKD